MAKTDTLTDNFATQNDALWDYDGATVSGGQLRIIPTTSYPSIVSGAYDLTESSLLIELVQNANVGNGGTEVEFAVQASTGNTCGFYIGAGTLYFLERIAGVENSTTVAYNATNHRWLKLTHTGSTVSWWVSADGINWGTVARSKTAGITLTAVQIYVAAGYFGTEPSPGTAIFDNVNLPPVAAASSGWLINRLAMKGTSSGIATRPGSDVFPFVQTAAATYGWTSPSRSDDFMTNPTDGVHEWIVTDSAGHDGNGTRSPAALSVTTANNGILTITGNTSGQTGALTWYPGPLYGRWEIALRCPAGSLDYHPVLLLWPNESDDWEAEGEVDWMEIHDNANRQTAHYFLHYGVANAQAVNFTKDCTQWHAWALEWRADHITAYCDGVPWYHTTNTTYIPNTAHYLSMQLDNFDYVDGMPSPQSTMEFAWAYEYP